MTEPTMRVPCPHCQIPVVLAPFCSFCGAALMSTELGTATPRSKWYHSAWFVLLALTPFVLGPFALPLLWKSPNFSRRAKIVLTLVTVGWTALAVRYVFHVVIPAVTKEMNQLNAVFQP